MAQVYFKNQNILKFARNNPSYSHKPQQLSDDLTFAYSIKWGDKVLVAHDGEPDESVDGDQNMDDEAAGASRLQTN